LDLAIIDIALHILFERLRDIFHMILFKIQEASSGLFQIIPDWLVAQPYFEQGEGSLDARLRLA
jgi:hypothetical protein